ncbi:MAG: transcriptional regulator with XRE-family HTH domain [Gammaproteobacteria bacterium]|jgi:transcriptional regulator with XRE-family HTH domain
MSRNNKTIKNSLPVISEESLESLIGAQLKALRNLGRLTIKDLAIETGLSSAMLSKLENGSASPSLNTLKTLSGFFNVSVASLFRETELRNDVSFVRSGEGVRISRQGPKEKHEFRLLGHSSNSSIIMEPFQVELHNKADVYPHYQGSGTWFIHMQQGEMDFRCGNEMYRLKPGDSLMYDAYSQNGPELLIEVPIRYLCVRADRRTKENAQ